MTKTMPLNSFLLERAANNRHGVTFLAQVAQVSHSEVPGVFHVGVPNSLLDNWNSASGGVSFNKNDAFLAAIGESIERYCAATTPVTTKSLENLKSADVIQASQFSLFSIDQISHADFPHGNIYSPNCGFTNVYKLRNNAQVWVPQPLVVLRDDYATNLPTSSGLAAGETITDALLRAGQELIERDALMTTWMHSLPGKRIELPKYLQEKSDLVLGEVYAFDLTPRYSPFPVIAVCGRVPIRGKQRFSLGVACKQTLHDSIEKAFLEWTQGIYFSGVFPKHNDTSDLTQAHKVHSFDDHAMYYTVNEKLVDQLPILSNKAQFNEPSIKGELLSSDQALLLMVNRLYDFNIELYYRDLTTIDALQSGVRVVRVLSPDLVPIHAQHSWPCVGGTASNLPMRYDLNLDQSRFPNPFPHPLG